MLFGRAGESAPGGLQGRPRHSAEIGIFTQALLGAYIYFDKTAQQAQSVLYALARCDRRQVPRLLDGHLRFTDIAPKILRSQIFDLKPVDDIQIRILPIKLLNEVC